MIGDKGTYAVPEKNWLRSAAVGGTTGTTFRDHGKTMEVTEVGRAYQVGKERLIDIETVEVERRASPQLVTK